MNVTAPFKQDMALLMDELDEPSQKIGGVNTVVRKGKKLVGYNTDYLGVSGALISGGIDIKNKHCVVLGCGGAGRAAVYALIKQGAIVTVVNRTFSKGKELASQMGCQTVQFDDLEKILGKTELLISTLSNGIDPVKEEWIHPWLIVFDANYKHSPLVEKALKKGCSVITGEEWLLQQAYPAYEYFTGEILHEKEKKIMKDALHSAQWIYPGNVSLIGFMGSGKTTVGKIIGEKLGMGFIDTDDLIEKKEIKTIRDIFEKMGEDYFREVESAVLKDELSNNKNIIYGCGGGIVIKEKNRLLLQSKSLPVWLYASLETSLTRAEPATRPLLDGNSQERISKAGKLFNERLDYYWNASELIISSESEAEVTAEKINAEIRRAFNY